MTALVSCIGGGQLGRMLALAGAPLGVRMRFLDPAPDACAGQVGELVLGAYDDPDALDRLVDGADAVTYEFENVPVEAARRVGALPEARALELGQDRLVEKELFRRLGIETAPFGSLVDTGVPALVKSRRLGYDGKGQRRVEAVEPLGDDEIAESLVAFDRELSIVAVRGRNGDTRFYPLAENEHRGGILAVSCAPAPHAPQREAEEIATSELGDDPRLLELTLANGADVRSLDSYHGTGLIRAADRGFTTIVARLLETDIDIDHVNRLGWTALLEAIILGSGDAEHVEVVRQLVEAGADVNLADNQGMTPLAHAEDAGFDEMAAILREAGATR